MSVEAANTDTNVANSHSSLEVNIGLVKLAEAATAATTSTTATTTTIALPVGSASATATIAVSLAEIEAGAFTKEWIARIFAVADEKAEKGFESWRRKPRQSLERKKLVAETLLGTTQVNVINRLQLDYELAPGYTLLPCILDAICCYDDYMDDSKRIGRSDRPKLMADILSNVTLNGYTNGLKKPFDPDHIWTPDLEPSRAQPEKINILAFILRLAPIFREGDGEPIERTYFDWLLKLLTIILEQPSLTPEMRHQLANPSSSASTDKPWLDFVVAESDAYVPICKLLLKHGADINRIRPGFDVLPPLGQIIRETDNIVLLIEMLLCTQANLLTIELSQYTQPTPLKGHPHFLVRTSILSDVRDRPRLITNDLATLRYSSPKRLSKRIILKLNQWQEEQRTQLTADANFQPNDAPIRDWLRQLLSTLTTELFSSNMQSQLRKLARLPPTRAAHTELKKSLIDRWILQLTDGPEHIHLTEISGNHQHLTTLFVDSMTLFFDPAFRSHVPQILGMLNDTPFVDGLAFFANDHTGYLSILNTIGNQFQLISSNVDPAERVQQGQILLKLLDICASRLHCIVEEWRSPTEMRRGEYLNQMKRLCEYDLNDDTNDSELWDNYLSHLVSKPALGLPSTILSLIKKMCWFSSLEVFQEIWCNILPKLSSFRHQATMYYYESLNFLILSSYHYYNEGAEYMDLPDATMAKARARTRSFLESSLFQSSDLFAPFQLLPTPPFKKKGDGLNLVFFVMKKENDLKERRNKINTDETKKSLLDDVIDLEAKWRTVHWPGIRTNLEEFIISDLVDVVMNYLQPSGSVSRSDLSAGLLSPPAQFVLQPPSKPSHHSFTSSTATSNVVSTSSATSAPTTATGAPATKFSLAAFTWPPSTVTATATTTSTFTSTSTTSTVVSSPSNPFIFPSTSASFSTSSNPFLTPTTTTTTTSMDFSSGTVNPFLLTTTGSHAFDSAAVSGTFIPPGTTTTSFINDSTQSSNSATLNLTFHPHPFHPSASSTSNSSGVVASPSIPPPITPPVESVPASRLVGIELNRGPSRSDGQSTGSVVSASASSISTIDASSTPFVNSSSSSDNNIPLANHATPTVSTNSSPSTNIHDSSVLDVPIAASSNSIRFGDMTLSELGELYHRLKGPFEEIEDAYRTRLATETNSHYDHTIFTSNTAHVKRFTQWRLLPKDILLVMSAYLSNTELCTVSCVNRRWLSGTKLPLDERHRKFIAKDPSWCKRCHSVWSQIRLNEWLTSHPMEVASIPDNQFPITTLLDCILGASEDRVWCRGCYGEWMCPPCGLKKDGWMNYYNARSNRRLARCDDCGYGYGYCDNCISLDYCQFCSAKSCCGGVTQHQYRQMCRRCAEESER